MSLFVCEECGVVENTALSNYWVRTTRTDRALCSQCDPRIGRWHGKFPRDPYIGQSIVLNPPEPDA